MFNPFLHKSNFKNYISNIIEVGYTQYGPTISIAGNMTAIHKVVFVYNIALELQRKNASGRYQFHWFAFRPHKFNTGGFTGIDFKMPSKFMVSPSEAFNYNIFFTDHNRYAEMSLFLKRLKKEWEKLIETTASAASPLNFQALFENFVKHDSVLEALGQLQKMCYWQKDEYLLKIKIILNDQPESLDVEKYFSLTDEDFTNLQKNVTTIIADLCKQPNIIYHYACPCLR